MARTDWLVGDRHDAAAERIYAAATELVSIFTPMVALAISPPMFIPRLVGISFWPP